MRLLFQDVYTIDFEHMRERLCPGWIPMTHHDLLHTARARTAKKQDREGSELGRHGENEKTQATINETVAKGIRTRATNMNCF